MREFNRKPIYVNRKPIYVQRKSIVSFPLVGNISFERVHETFKNLIKYFSKRMYYTNGKDVGIDSQDLYQEGNLVLIDCYSRYKDKNLVEFKAIFTRSLTRAFLKRLDRFTINTTNTVELDTIFDLGYETDVMEGLSWEESLANLRKELQKDPIAARILEELINPSAEVIQEVNKDKARKAMLKSQGRGNASFSDKIKYTHIQRSMKGVTQKSFSKSLRNLRVITSQYFKNRDMENYLN